MVIVSKLHLLGDAAGYCVNGKFAATLFRSLSDGGGRHLFVRRRRSRWNQ